MASDDIVKAGLAVIRDGRILLCRKNRDTSLLILPGGHIESGETSEECLHREIREELGSEVADLCYIATYRDVAAGAEDRWVEIRLYRGEVSDNPRPQAEIAELVWFPPAGDQSLLAPSLRNQILPDLIVRGLLQRVIQPFSG